ncbi:MAG TPA: hypothetical protein VM901_13630 [Bdellovibrionota bacterium]|nr:hypothetical protein [Bdellovibrionota bacterium]
MPIVTIVYGLLLLALGIISYVGTGMISVTALIPAFFGLPLVICGFLARDEAKLRHAMHAAAMLGLLGFLGSLRGLLSLPALLSGEALERPDAVKAQAIMAILSLIFVVLCVKSFIDVRRARKNA